MDIPVFIVVLLGVLAVWGLAAPVLLLRARAAAGSAREEAESARVVAGQEAAARRTLSEEVRHLAVVRVPGLLQHVAHPTHPVPPAAHPELAGSDTGSAMQSVLDQLAEALQDTQIRTDEAAQGIMRTVTGRVRTLAGQMEKLLEQAQHQFGDRPEFTPVLYELDHRTVLMRRIVQTAAVVCGDAPGLARQDSYLADLVTSAQSRVESYGRIEIADHLPPGQEVGVAAPAAEALAMILAELMDNAAYCTVGSLPVKVGIHRTAAGAAVVISDAGPGLDTEEKQRFALRMLDTERRILLTELGAPPKLGLAAIGRLTRRHPIQLSIGPSATRGTEVVVHVDASLLVAMEHVHTSAGPMSVPAEQAEPLHVAERQYAPQAVADELPVRLRPEPAAEPSVLPGSYGASGPSPVPDPSAGLGPSAAPGGLPRRRRRAPAASPAAGPRSEPRPNDPLATRDRYAGMQAAFGRARSESNATDEEHSR